jgi:FixJ family two-component response regulator
MSISKNAPNDELATVYVVDDDPAVRDSLSLLLEQEGVVVETFPDGEAFLAACGAAPTRSCAIVDVRMPGMDGLQLHAELLRRGIHIPVIFLTGHGDIPMSVRAIKAGAVDFLTKPISGVSLHESLRTALHESERVNSRDQETQTAKQRIDSLTLRERQVMQLAVQGQANKEIARHLGISHRTVEIHRARVMQKTGADTLLDLAQLAQKGGAAAEEI